VCVTVYGRVCLTRIHPPTQGRDTYANLAVTIHQDLENSLTGFLSTAHRNLTVPWVASMVRMREHFAAAPFMVAEALQDLDAPALALLVAKLDNTLLEQAATESGFHVYLDVECFIPQVQYVVKQPYKHFMKDSRDIGMTDTEGTRSAATIRLSAAWAHFLVHGAYMKRITWIDQLTEITSHMKTEKELQGEIAMLELHRQTPTFTRKNYMDHELISRIEKGGVCDCSNTLTHPLADTTHRHTHTHAEGKALSTTILIMRALADIAVLRIPREEKAKEHTSGLRMKPSARPLLAVLVDAYHASHPSN
jgi:hypothetical protein